jgi:hypothetical protein
MYCRKRCSVRGRDDRLPLAGRLSLFIIIGQRDKEVTTSSADAGFKDRDYNYDSDLLDLKKSNDRLE